MPATKLRTLSGLLVLAAVAFTAAWTGQAAGEDETGLYLVGTLLVLAGMTAGPTPVSPGIEHLAKHVNE
jgi:hypothetical protein